MRHIWRWGGLLVAVLIGRTRMGAAQVTADTAAMIDKVFAAVNRTDSPGCSVGINRGGQPLFRNGYGMASLEVGVPLTESSILESGSVAKQFTAGAVVHLALQGKLGLDDPVRKYIPELPDYGAPVTIRMLLHHTSGVRDMWTLFGLTGREPGTVLYTMSEALRMVYRQRELNFPPNSEYLYSNSGFLLLAEIVKRVAGKPLAQYSREVFFRPLGMDHTQWRDDWNRVVPGRATAYSPGPGGFRVDMPFMSVYGAGGLLTTVGDVLRWNDNLTNPVVGGRVWADTLQRPGRLNSGKSINYAFGLIVTAYRGEPEISHSGATGGYRTFLGRWPTRSLSAAVFCNVANANPISLGHQVADVFLGPKPKAEGTAAIGAAGQDVGELASYVGRYRAPATEAGLVITQDAGRLIADVGVKLPLTAVTHDHFRIAEANVDLYFSRATGRITKLAEVSESDTTWYEPVVAPPLDSRRLAAYAGSYYSPELDVTYTATVADTTLSVRIGEGEPKTLTPTGPDLFAIPGGATARFTRVKGQVDGFLLFAGRVKNLRFTRR